MHREKNSNAPAAGQANLIHTDGMADGLVAAIAVIPLMWAVTLGVILVPADVLTILGFLILGVLIPPVSGRDSSRGVHVRPHGDGFVVCTQRRTHGLFIDKSRAMEAAEQVRLMEGLLYVQFHPWVPLGTDSH